MKVKQYVPRGPLLGVAILFIAAGANAATIINYTTNAAGTKFVGGTDVMNSTGGQAATLTFTPNTTSGAGVPSNIDLGDFLLACPTCSSVQSTTFGSFAFDLIVSDTTDGATGEFVGTSSGGTVSSNSSTVSITWTGPPGLELGPGTNFVLTGNFGLTEFNMVSPTSLIVSPNSGTPPGDTSIQAQLSSQTPEPTTLVLMGGALAGLGLLRRKKLVSPK